MIKALALIAILCMSFGTQIQKDWTAKGTQEQWIYVVRSLTEISEWADKQNAPNLEVKAVRARIDSIQRFLVPQLNAQIDTTKKK